MNDYFIPALIIFTAVGVLYLVIKEMANPKPNALCEYEQHLVRQFEDKQAYLHIVNKDKDVEKVKARIGDYVLVRETNKVFMYRCDDMGIAYFALVAHFPELAKRH